MTPRSARPLSMLLAAACPVAMGGCAAAPSLEDAAADARARQLAPRPAATKIDHFKRSELEARLRGAIFRDDDGARVAALLDLARLYLSHDLPDLARDYLYEAYDLQSAAADRQALADTALALARVHNQVGEPNLAESMARRALEFDTDLALVVAATQALENTAALQIARDNAEQGQRILADTRTLRATRIEPLRRLQNVLELADDSARRGALARAHEMYILALDMSYELDAWHQTTLAHHALGALREVQRDLDNARRFYYQALESVLPGGRCALQRTVLESLRRVEATPAARP